MTVAASPCDPRRPRITRRNKIVNRYLRLGLRLGRLVDGLVDAYYGPADVAEEVANEPPPDASALLADAEQLIALIDAGEGDLSTRYPNFYSDRRAWLRAQVVGLHTTARKLAGDDIGYADEVELCYGVRPQRIDEDEIAAVHRDLDEVLPGRGDLRERYIMWREGQAIAPGLIEEAIRFLVGDFATRTHEYFGLPDYSRCKFELVSNKPWSAFNYYFGDYQSRVEINTDLPVLATSLGHLVAHEAYPGHHTEHCIKERDVVNGQGQLEETLFLVGTPQCLVAEGLADLGLEILYGEWPEFVLEETMQAVGVPYDALVVAGVRKAGEVLSAVRGNLAILAHEDGADLADVVAYAERWMLQPRDRAWKAVEFLLNPTWRAYISCYVEGLPLCREFVVRESEKSGWVKNHDDTLDFRAYLGLLCHQVTPADLRREDFPNFPPEPEPEPDPANQASNLT